VTEAILRHEQFNVPFWYRQSLPPGRYALEGTEFFLTVSPSFVLRGLRRAFPDLRVGQAIALERTAAGLRAGLLEPDEVAQ